jgi:cytochrome b
MIKVWSLFVRLSHWLLVAAFFTAFTLRNSEWYRQIHVYAGYTAGVILIARIVWGFIGTGYERFSAFPFNIPAAINFVKTFFSHPKRYIGHNPAGSLVIYSMLGIGLITVITGIVVYNDAYLPFSSDTLEYFHEYPAWAWAVLVAMHISGVLVESWLHKENLIATMITGNKKAD